MAGPFPSQGTSTTSKPSGLSTSTANPAGAENRYRSVFPSPFPPATTAPPNDRKRQESFSPLPFECPLFPASRQPSDLFIQTRTLRSRSPCWDLSSTRRRPRRARAFCAWRRVRRRTLLHQLPESAQIGVKASVERTSFPAGRPSRASWTMHTWTRLRMPKAWAMKTTSNHAKKNCSCGNCLSIQQRSSLLPSLVVWPPIHHFPNGHRSSITLSALGPVLLCRGTIAGEILSHCSHDRHYSTWNRQSCGPGTPIRQGQGEASLLMPRNTAAFSCLICHPGARANDRSWLIRQRTIAKSACGITTSVM